jgi:nucleoside-diphosphate-sugar epimerase
MTILVSGGTGFVGRFIVENLLAAGRDVSVLGRVGPSAGFFSREVGFVEGALDPDRDQRAAFAGVEAFVHAAFDHLPGRYRGGEGDDPDGFRRRNIDGTAALFAQAKAAGVGRVVFLSSRAVYGAQPPGMALLEETAPHPDTLYGEVKRAAEAALRSLGDDGFLGVSLRVTGVYGPPGPGQEHKWAALFRDWLAGRAITPRVATEVHGRDVAEAVRLVLATPQTALPGDLLNVSDIVVDRRDLLAMVKAATGAAHALPPRADVAALNVADTARLRGFGWRPGGWDLLENTVRALVAPPAARGL